MSEPRRTALPRARSLRFYANRVSFPGCLWPIILLVPISGLSFLVARASLGQDGFQDEGFWEAGLYPGLASPPSLGPSRILPVSFQWQHHVPNPGLLW